MKRKTILAAFMVVALGGLVGCGRTEKTTDTTSTEGTITVQVGTMGTYSPFSY